MGDDVGRQDQETRSAIGRTLVKYLRLGFVALPIDGPMLLRPKMGALRSVPAANARG